MARKTAAETAKTRAAIVRSARTLFAADGFAAVPTTAIAESAGVTRGAVYHHFADKTDLFREVFVDLEAELDDAVGAAVAGESDVIAAVRAGVGAVLDFMTRPDYRQIASVDGPAVLGMSEWRRIDTATGLASLQALLESLAARDLLDVPPSRELAVLLFGALTEAGLALGQPEPGTTRDRLVDQFMDLVERLGRPRP